MNIGARAWILAGLGVLAPAGVGLGQAGTSGMVNAGVQGLGSQALATAETQQTAQIFGLEGKLEQLAGLRAKRGCGDPASLEELTVRQEVLEGVQTASLDVDGALAEITNEQGKLSDLRTTLQARRDATVAKLNTAALITGAALGAVVSGTQFTTLSSRVNNVGDGNGIGSGVASTVLSVVATRKTGGPSGTVGEVPNMLATLFDRAAVLNTYYPAPVLRFLESVEANGVAQGMTRLEKLKERWGQTGRLAAGDPGKVVALTSSGDAGVKVTIADLTDRIAMLTDVAGVVSLVKRDLAVLMRSSMGGGEACTGP